MANYKVKKGSISNKKSNIKGNKPHYKKGSSSISVLKYIILGAIGVVMIGGEIKQRIDADHIIKYAGYQVPRSFKDIDKKNMGKYLENQINLLYKEYPEVDEWLYEGSEKTKDQEFISSIYNLYKAYLVDEKGKEVESIDDTVIRTKDQIIFNSDVLKTKATVENKETGEDEVVYEKVAETHDERNKIITNAYIEATDENGDRDGATLAKEIYELLAKKVGLKEKVETSKKISDKIEEDGFYYDSVNEAFYTEVGKAKLVNEKELEELEEKAKQATDSEREQDEKEDTSTTRESEEMEIG